MGVDVEGQLCREDAHVCTCHAPAPQSVYAWCKPPLSPSPRARDKIVRKLFSFLVLALVFSPSLTYS